MSTNFNPLEYLPRPIRYRLVLRTAVVIAVSLASPGLAAPPQWQWVDNDCGLKTIVHERRPNTPPEPACDHLKIFCGQGTFAHLAMPIQPLTIISELKIEVPFRSSQTGHQILARVVLPRSLDPQTGLPLTLLVPGTSSQLRDQWRFLTIERLDEQLSQQTRLLRAKRKTPVDPRQAYVDHVIINAYSEPGLTELSIRDPKLTGIAPYEPTLSRTIAPANYTHPAVASSSVVKPASTTMGIRSLEKKQHGVTEARLRIDGTMLLVEDRPFFVRAVQANGEDWSFLKGLGFNTIQIGHPPTPSEIQRAEELDLWIIAPPPQAWNGEDLSQPFRRVICWRLDTKSSSPSSPRDGREFRTRMQAIEAMVRRTPRPIAFVRRLASQASPDIEIFEPPTAEIIPQYPNVTVKPWRHSSTVGWAAVDLQPERRVCEQFEAFRDVDHRLDALFGSAISFTGIETYQRYLAAATSGVKGIVCDSTARLDTEDSNFVNCCRAIRLANHELQIMAPWLAGGQVCDELIQAGNGFVATATRTDRGWFLTVRPTKCSNLPKEATIRLAGPAESATVLLANRGGLERLPTVRVAGGCEFRFSTNGPKHLFVTSDPRIAKSIGLHFKPTSKATARWRWKLVAADVDEIESVRKQLPVSFDGAFRIDQHIDLIHGFLRRCQDYDESDDRNGMAANAAAAQWQLEQLRTLMDDAVAKLSSMQTAFANHHASHALHLALQDFADHETSENLLEEANMEDLQQLQWKGWENFIRQTHEASPSSEYTAGTVALTNDRPCQGKTCLRINAIATPSPQNQHIQPTLWVKSRSVPVPRGSVIKISGYVRVPPQREDGAAFIADSLGGPGLLVRPQPSGNWQPFSVLRAVGSNDCVTLSIGQCGMGQVDFDDIQIRQLNIRQELHETSNVPSRLTLDLAP